jgi:hypothetical protein
MKRNAVVPGEIDCNNRNAGLLAANLSLLQLLRKPPPLHQTLRDHTQDGQARTPDSGTICRAVWKQRDQVGGLYVIFMMLDRMTLLLETWD